MAVYALERQHVNIPNDTNKFSYHTIFTRSHVVFMVHDTCLNGWIKASCWDRYTPELEGFGLYMTIRSFRRWVYPFFRDFPLSIQSFCPLFFVSWWRERLKEHGLTVVPNHVHWRVVEQISRVSKSCNPAITWLRKIFENLRKFWTFERETGKN